MGYPTDPLRYADLPDLFLPIYSKPYSAPTTPKSLGGVEHRLSECVGFHRIVPFTILNTPLLQPHIPWGFDSSTGIRWTTLFDTGIREPPVRSDIFNILIV